MDNESTILLNNEPPTYNSSNQSAVSQNRTEKKSAGAKIAAAGAAGLAVGAAAGAAVSAYAAQPSVDVVAEVDNTSGETGISAAESDGAIRYADVSGAGSFNEAFASARAQVGPGGAFEYHGKLYSTYYAEEWNAMSPGERAEHSQRIIAEAPNHNAITSSGTQTVNHHHYHHYDNPSAQEENSPEPKPGENNAHHPGNNPDPEPGPVDPTPVVNPEIRVLDVEVVYDSDGNPMNVALVESGGDQALLVDVDYNGTIDVMIHDDNGDGAIQADEVHDISDIGLTIDDLAQQLTPPEDNIYYTNCDGMPDYVNDADSIMMA